MLELTRFRCGTEKNPAVLALERWLSETETDRSYLPMMQLRLAGGAKNLCEDVYYIATQENEAVARLWNGWGKHPGAVGNFGNFMTKENFRGQGVGKRLLSLWMEDLTARKDLPIGLFCSAMHGFLIDLYASYGFQQAVILSQSSMLYKPLGDSPKDFRELCKIYYAPTKTLRIQPASIQWRHEIDCLLKFFLSGERLSFGLPGAKSLEEALVWPQIGTAEILFQENDRAVGWSFTPPGGEKRWQIHPNYREIFLDTMPEERSYLL